MAWAGAPVSVRGLPGTAEYALKALIRQYNQKASRSWNGQWTKMS